MVSDFRKKKYLHVFHTLIDADKSGVIDRKDFSLAAERIGKLRNYKPGDTTYEVTKELLVAIWADMLKQGDTDGNGEITADEWVKMWDRYAHNPANAYEFQKLYAKAVFELEDATHDGAIDANEFAETYEMYGMKKEDSIEAFKKLSGGKEKITWEEFQKLYQEYFTTDDVNAPGNYIFGKI